MSGTPPGAWTGLGPGSIGEFRLGIEPPWVRTARDKSQIDTRAETALKPGYLLINRSGALVPRLGGHCPVRALAGDHDVLRPHAGREVLAGPMAVLGIDR